MSASSAAIVIVMGVSGSGKTTLARALEAGHGFRFLDADDFHPAANVEKMRAGIALDDADRMPWLSQLARLLEDAAERGQPTVLACSALKARYREALAITGATRPLRSSPRRRGLAESPRLAEQRHHYMPASLLRSQLATLEVPAGDARALTLDCRRPVSELCEAVIGRLASDADAAAG